MGLYTDLNNACHDYEHHRALAALHTPEGVAVYQRLLYLLSNTAYGCHDFRGVRYQYQRHVKDICRIPGCRPMPGAEVRHGRSGDPRPGGRGRVAS